MQERMTIAVIIVVLALFALLVKVYLIQRDNNENYNKIVLSQRQSEYVSRTLTARRGDIYDRNGTKLASSDKVYNLILDPKQMDSAEGWSKDRTTYVRLVIEPTAYAIADFFGEDRNEVKSMLDSKKDSSYVRYKREMSYDDKQAFEEFIEDQNKKYAASDQVAERKKSIKGVWFEEEYKRNYPNNSLGCNIVGFSTADGSKGIGGVEQYYNDELVGVNGREYGYLDDEANLEKVVRSAQNGNSLILTMDASVQSIVEKYLAEWKNGEVGSDNAACLVMDPNTGEILAMASTNSFDLNNPRTTGDFTDEEVYAYGLTEGVRAYKREHPDAEPITEAEVPEYYSREDIMSFGQQDVWNIIWRNFCVSDTYEPGSVQKIFTVAGALEEGLINMEQTFNCEGNIKLSDGVNTWRINCVNRNGHGLLDVTGGITQSCNVVMMNIAFLEKSETFMKYQRIFGLGDYTGIDLPAETDTEALGFESDDIGRTSLATNSFGQNYNCTMIQMAAGISSIVNGGYYYTPHVLKQIQSADGTIIKDVEPTLVRQTVSESTCNQLKEAMYKTVESGTGSAAKVAGYKVGGKTGTAQKLPRSAQTYVVSFMGFAPVDDPQLVCYVVVDEPHLPGQAAAHSSFASGIFSKVMAEALPAIGVYPEGTTASEYRPPEVLKDEAEGDSGMALGTREETAEETGPVITDMFSEDGQAETNAEYKTAEEQTDEYVAGDADESGEQGLPDVLSELVEESENVSESEG